MDQGLPSTNVCHYCVALGQDSSSWDTVGTSRVAKVDNFVEGLPDFNGLGAFWSVHNLVAPLDARVAQQLLSSYTLAVAL